MEFLEELEEDPKTRACVNVYHDTDKEAAAAPVEGLEELEHDAPTISVEEMLNELDIGGEASGSGEQREDADEQWHDAQEDDDMEQ